MSDPLLASYEEVPYNGGPISSSHPDSLATVATLHGMSPAPVDRCRVLELGCATGGNLLGMAVSLPGASFVGVDLAPRQIAAARALADAVGLRNVELAALSIADIDDAFGAFDYIVCHGVYSWVPAEIRQAILRVCARNLAPNGVAYVSYNTFPGWHARSMVREMLLFHDDAGRLPAERVERGRAFMEFLARSASTETSVYRAVLGQELIALRTMTDSHFLHEELEAFNEPVYFTDFVRSAAGHELGFLAEAGLLGQVASLAPEVQTQLRTWTTDPIALAQYGDFLSNRTFRRSLLCHASVTRSAEPTSSSISSLCLSARVAPTAAAADPGEVVTEEFAAPEGRSVETNHPLVRAALHTLFEALPGALPFEELWQRVSARAARAPRGDGGSGDGPGWLAEALLQCATSRLVALHLRAPPCVAALAPRPGASPLARIEAAAGARVTNLRHQNVELMPFDRVILAHLDGTRARPALLDLMRDAARRGELTSTAGEVTDGDLTRALDATLERLAAAALIVA